jgi:glycerol-3-phosphate O-acyltransferase 1/2
VPHIALDAAIVTAMAGTINENCPYLTLSDIIDVTMQYCDILRYEFIFCKPCQDMNDQVEQAVKCLCDSDIIVKVNDEYALNVEKSKTLLSTLAPFNITYWSTTECLKTLYEKAQMLEKDFHKLCLNILSEKFNEGTITYGESISTDTIKNCLKLLEKWAVVEVDTQSGVRIVSLTSLYNTQTGIENVIEKIERFVIAK